MDVDDGFYFTHQLACWALAHALFNMLSLVGPMEAFPFEVCHGAVHAVVAGYGVVYTLYIVVYPLF